MSYHTLLRKMASYRLELPELFSGEDGKDFHQWIRRFEVAACAFSESNLHTLLPARLSGSAFTVWESMKDADKKDFKKIKDKLSQVFGRSQFIETFKSCITARSRKPGEPLEVFASAIVSLVEEAFPNYDSNAKEGETFRRFIAGLQRPLQVKIHEMGGATFDEALNIALRVERANDIQGSNIGVATVNQSKDTSAETHLTQLLLQRLNDVEKKLEQVSLDFKAATNIRETQMRPSVRSPRRRDFSQSYQSPSIQYKDGQYFDQLDERRHSRSGFAHQSPHPYDYQQRHASPHVRRLRSPSPSPDTLRYSWRNSNQQDQRSQYLGPQYRQQRSPSPRRYRDRYGDSDYQRPPFHGQGPPSSSRRGDYSDKRHVRFDDQAENCY